jgi:Mg2+/Co2+ transporter CorB
LLTVSLLVCLLAAAGGGALGALVQGIVFATVVIVGHSVLTFLVLIFVSLILALPMICFVCVCSLVARSMQWVANTMRVRLCRGFGLPVLGRNAVESRLASPESQTLDLAKKEETHEDRSAIKRRGSR